MPFAHRSVCLRIVFAAAAVASTGCLGFSHHPRQHPLPAAAEQAGLRRVEVEAGRYIGLSDLSAERLADGSRKLWLVPERQRALLHLEAPRTGGATYVSGTSDAVSRPQLLQARPAARSIEGVPPYLDTESMAVLGDGKFALGTEAPWPNRTHDDVLFVTLQAGVARVTHTVPFAYAPYGLSGGSNAGIEGLCSDGVVLLATSETSGDLPDGGRFAPLGRLGANDKAFVPYRLQLTSPTGRISALACRPNKDGGEAATEVVAIERHYGVARLLHFVLPHALPPGALLRPQVALDLEPLVRPLVNYEGVSWLDDGDLLLVADNSIGFATGPTEGLVVPAGMLQTSAP